MDNNKIFTNFINKLKEDKTDAEVEKFLTDLFTLSGTQLYLMILANLTEEDMTELDKITDEEQGRDEVLKRFQMRTGMTALEYVTKLRDAMAKGYLDKDKTEQ